jgi:hypothetical protein
MPLVMVLRAVELKTLKLHPLPPMIKLKKSEHATTSRP